MCEHDDLDEFARSVAGVSRRQFGALTLAAGIAALLPKAGRCNGDQRRGNRDQNARWPVRTPFSCIPRRASIRVC